LITSWSCNITLLSGAVLILRFYNIPMQSLSKTTVSKPLAESIIARHFGSRASISGFHELTEGFFNAAYYLELKDGSRYVLKVAPPPTVQVLRYEKNIMQTEVEVMRLVKAETDIPVPEILTYDSTQELIESDYFIMEYIDGIPLNKLRGALPVEERHKIDVKTGQFLRQMNAITGKKFGYFSQLEMQSENWRETFVRMLQNVLTDGKEAGVTLPVDYDTLYPMLGSAFYALDEIQTPCLVHWDLWDGNIFIDPDTYQITGLIDFERALWADPLMEANFGAFGTNPSFLEGYGKEMLATRNQKIRHTLYDIYLFLIMIIECHYRKYETDQQENLARGKLITELDILKGLLA
jgi:aminoglycoside phosphotransferase (APT) family kinase protein